jgi:microsomal dipeptidase-like Zn-dependent dipeptidase
MKGKAKGPMAKPGRALRFSLVGGLSLVAVFDGSAAAEPRPTRPDATSGVAEPATGANQPRLITPGPSNAKRPAAAPQPVDIGMRKPTPDSKVVKVERLRGFADLHTHPMSHLGFGRKAMHGAPDIDILVPGSTTMGCGSREKRAANMSEALGNCNATHGGWGTDNSCGDHLRAVVINDALDGDFWHVVGHERNLHNDHPHDGYPNFSHWPHHSSILHQQMWWEWLKRAHEGGLRVMVALTVNSETLGDVLSGDAPYDDKSVADRQIDETIRFAGRHPEFMKIAYSAAEAESIVREGKLAVILGMEVDRIGNFGKPGVRTDAAAVRAELARLYGKGIRYVFPIHLIDNAFGGTAVYQMLMNMANRQQNGRFFQIVHSDDPLVTYRANFVSSEPYGDPFASLGIYAALEVLQFLPAPCGEFWKGCAPFTVGCCGNFQRIKGMLTPSFDWEEYKRVPPGHVNARSLTPLGEVAVKEMMRLGMIVDVDHMSERALTKTVEIAETVAPGGYPLVMGHNGIRGAAGNERGAPAAIADRIAKLGGIMGVGTAHANAADFAQSYKRASDVFAAAHGNVALGLGTDANGFEPLPHRGPGNAFTRDVVVTVPGDAWNHPPASLSCPRAGSSRSSGGSKIDVRSARIGCLDIQRAANLTAHVSVACEGRNSCEFKAPSEDAYRRMGVSAATRTFCTQAMEIVYRCESRPAPTVSSANFYASFLRDSGVSGKQRKPGGGEWDYISEGGVSHYGLMPEFLHEVRQEDPQVFENIMSSADAFVRVWRRIDAVKSQVNTGAVEGTQTYTLPRVSGLCPAGVVAGDAEFDGHGPQVRGSVKLQLDPTGTNVQAVVKFTARETTANWSEVRGTWTVNVGDPAPRGFKYYALAGPAEGTFDQVLIGGGRVEPLEGCDGSQHLVKAKAAGRDFAELIVVGDTGGGDISGDANCHCDTRIQSIDFSPVRITLRRR